MNSLTSPTAPKCYEAYTGHMASSMDEKLFFLADIPQDVKAFIDFGCADGALLRELAQRRDAASATYLLGYDPDPEMLRLATAKGDPTISYVGSWDALVSKIGTLNRMGMKSCIILSSVVHEAVGKGAEFSSMEELMDTIESLRCTYIVIRDMAPPAASKFTPVSSEELEALKRNRAMQRTMLYAAPVPGFVTNRALMLQCLLKYRYVENFFKEAREDYFPATAEDWEDAGTTSPTYHLRFFRHYSSQGHRAKWAEDFGLDIQDPTHIQLIMERKHYGW